jgi:hypothetical protein
MARCIYCGRDKGRRECPALGGLISTSCCGGHRGIRIDCPPHCKYFKEHEEYQRARLGPHFHQAWIDATERFYRERRAELLDFILFLEISIYQHFLRQTRGTDEELREALEYLKRKLGPIEVIEAPGSQLGKHLFEAARQYLEKRPDLDADGAQEAVEALSAALQTFSDGAEPRRAIHGLLGHVEHYIGVPEGLSEEEPSAIEIPKIIRPGEQGAL